MGGDSKPQTSETALQRLERLRASAQGRRIVPMPMIRGIGHLIVDHTLILEVLSSTNFIRAPYLSDAFGEGLLLAEGERWSISRPVVQPFYTLKRLAGHAERLGKFADELCEKWVTAAQAGEEIDAVRDLVGLVFRSSVAVFSGVDLGPDDPRAEALVRLTGAANQLAGLGIFDPKSLIQPSMAAALRDDRKALEEVARELIERRKAESHEGSPPNDLMSALLSPSFLEASVRGCPIGQKGLFDEIVLLLQASVETTSSSTANAIELLGKHPEAVQRLRDEVNEKGVHTGQELPWVTACYREGLRLRPPVWFNGRCALKEYTLNSGDVIEEGGFVFVCPYLVHHDPELWDEVESYRPDRFIEGAVREGATYMPFGLGRHYCVGASLATLVATSVLSRVFGVLDIEILARASSEPHAGFLLGPALDSKAKVTLAGSSSTSI